MDLNLCQIATKVLWISLLCCVALLFHRDYLKTAVVTFLLMLIFAAVNPLKYTADSARTIETQAPTTTPIPPRVTVDPVDCKAEQQHKRSTIRNDLKLEK